MTALLTTKTLLPRLRADAILRPRLASRLDEGSRRQLTLVSAPAGFGKTTLVRAWAETRPGTLWLSLDGGDRDPAVFLSYLIEALQGLSDRVGAAVAPLLRAPTPPPLGEVLTLVLNDLAAWPTPFVLVLDDYQAAASEPVNELLAALLDHQPPDLHLVVVTREDPPVALGRLRANGQVAEVRREDLRFGPDEAAAFLGRVMGLPVTEAQARTLEDRTEGWAAGLQLAALALGGLADLEKALASFQATSRFVEDYLFEEVLGRQSPEVRDFLRRSAVLDRFTGPLCDAVLGRTGSQDLLEVLDRANLFLVPLDPEGRWYRYHHLFADLLRRSLAAEEDPAVYHRRACQWYAAQGRPVEAFAEAVASEDLDLASRQVEGDGMPLYFQGVLGPVIAWLRGLAAPVRAHRPPLSVKLAWALLLSGRHSQVEEEVEAAEAGLDPVGTDPGQDDLWGQLSTLRAFVAIAHRQAGAILPLAQRALELLAPGNRSARAAAQCAVGVGFQYRGDGPAAEAAYEALVKVARSSGNRMFTAAGSIALGNLLVCDLRLPRAAEVFHLVLETVGDPADVLNCEAYLGLARIHTEWNDLEAAETHLGQAALLAGQIDCDTLMAVEALRGRLGLARNDPAAGAGLTRGLETALRHGWVQRAAELARWLVVVHLREGRLPAAARLADAHRLVRSRARVALAQGRPAEARTLLEAWLTTPPGPGLAEDRLEGLILVALAAQAAGVETRAHEALAEALDLASPGRLLRPFLDEGPALARLLAQGPHRQTHPLAEDLLGAFAAPPPTAGPPGLSDRELEILGLMAEGLSNQQIAERLFLSLSTVKWHNQNLFGKLQVQRRTEAIARARALSLHRTIL